MRHEVPTQSPEPTRAGALGASRSRGMFCVAAPARLSSGPGAMPRVFAILSFVFALAVGVVGCSRSTMASPELLEKVRQQVAKALRKDAIQLDVREPLGFQGANEQDIVVILIEVEDTFKVEIPDSSINKPPRELAKTLTIQKLADIVARQMEKHKR